MSDNVIKGIFAEKEKTAVQAILDAASNSDLDEVIIFGWTKNQSLYFSTTTCDASLLVYMCERIKAEVLKESQGEEDVSERE